MFGLKKMWGHPNLFCYAVRIEGLSTPKGIEEYLILLSAVSIMKA